MPPRRHRIAAWVAALALAAALASCGDEETTTGSTAAADPTATASTTTASEQAAGGEGSAAEAGVVVPEPGSEAEPDEVELYFTSGEQFEPVERPEPQTPGKEAELEAVTEELVEGPTQAESDRKVEVQTAIPADTEVRSVRLAGDGTAEVQLTSAFLRGVPADPGDRDEDEQAELDARVGQLAHTLGQFDGVRRTKVVAGGVAAPATEPDEYEKPARAPKEGAAAAAAKRRKGSGSASVRRLQRRLARLRYLPKSAVDGINGYRTEQAVIAFQSWEKLDRDGVVGPMTKAALADAHPPRPKLGGPSKRVEVYRDKGVALLVKDDRTKRAIHVSAGAAGTETPRGRFEVFRKELNSWSVPFQTWLPYASYFFQGIAFHEYPDVPPYPASHGCVRVPAPEAKVVYDFAGIGTAVAVR